MRFYGINKTSMVLSNPLNIFFFLMFFKGQGQCVFYWYANDQNIPSDTLIRWVLTYILNFQGFVRSYKDIFDIEILIGLDGHIAWINVKVAMLFKVYFKVRMHQQIALAVYS